jgi:preprotein translocase subunit SecF
MQFTSESVKYRFDFLKYRYVWLVVSIVYLVVGIGAYFALGGFKYNIDFTGGAEIRLSFEKPLELVQLRSMVSGGGWKDVIIQETGTNKREFLIRLGGEQEANVEQKILAALKASMPDNKATINGIAKVGAEVRSETTWNAIKAVFLAMLVLLLYIAVRFEFRFGLGAVVALAHDLLAILAFLVLTREQVSLDVLAAMMAILGYSVHDTIVIFSRIRENMKNLHNLSEYDIVNLSINQTLSRTLLTSFATMLSVIAILTLGGETLRGLSLIMFIGIIVGTYSSIYIASPVMMAVKAKKQAEAESA